MRIFRTLLAPIAGYAVIVFGTIATSKILGDVSVGSPASLIVEGAIGGILSGLIGGVLAALIAPSHRFAHAAAVLLFLTIDTSYVLTHFHDEPWWFTLSGSVALALSALAGGFAIAKRTATATAR